MSPICVRRLLSALSGRLLLVAIALLAFLFAGCSGKKATPPPGTPSDDIRLTAQAMMVTLQAASTTPVSEAAAVRATPVPSVATVMSSPSLIPRPSSPALEPTPLPATPEPVRLTRLAWSPDGKLLAVGSATGVYLYDTALWQEVRFIPVKVSIPSSLEDGVDDVAFSSDGQLIGTEGRDLEVWRVTDGSLAYELQGYAMLAGSPAEGLWAAFGGDRGLTGDLRLWRTSDGQLVREIFTGLQFPSALAFSPDGRLIVAGGTDSQPGVWQVADGQRVATLNWQGTEFFSWVDLAFRPDSSTVVAVGTDDVLLFWDTGAGSMRQLTGPNDMTKSPVVNRVSYAPEGSSFATSHSAGPGRQGGSVQLWNADGSRGQAWQIAAMPKDVAISPDGGLLATTDEQTIYIWRLRDGVLLKQIQPVWHHGILPTPTPTPLAAGLNLPNDWKEYLNQQSPVNSFKLKYPPTWEMGGEGGLSVVFRKKAAMQVEIMVGIWCQVDKNDPGNSVSLEWIKKTRGAMRNGGVFVTGGKWPLLIPATYAEFDKQIEPWEAEYLGVPGKSSIREVELYWWAQPDRCAMATLDVLSGEISEQDQLDLSRVLASVEFDNAQHPFLTATPTNTPMPLALPLQISVSPTTLLRPPKGGACPEITIEIKDANGQPMQGAQVSMSGQGYRDQFAYFYGQITWPLCEVFGDKIKVEVDWNDQLVASQEFAISWHKSPAAQPMMTSTPVAINKVTDVPSPKPLARPTVRACAIPVADELADLCEETRLGCPTGQAQITWGAWETFERGAMFWRSDTDEVYAFSQQGARSWLKIPDRWNGQEIKGRGNPPPGLQTPVRGFGFVWGERDDLFALLGWATDQERGFCFTLQPFERGFLMRSNSVQSCTPENYYNQATSPDWKPVSLAAYEGGWSDRRPDK